jgi:hypothetical protein
MVLPGPPGGRVRRRRPSYSDARFDPRDRSGRLSFPPVSSGTRAGAGELRDETRRRGGEGRDAEGGRPGVYLASKGMGMSFRGPASPFSHAPPTTQGRGIQPAPPRGPGRGSGTEPDARGTSRSAPASESGQTSPSSFGGGASISERWGRSGLTKAHRLACSRASTSRPRMRWRGDRPRTCLEQIPRSAPESGGRAGHGAAPPSE